MDRRPRCTTGKKICTALYIELNITRMEMAVMIAKAYGADMATEAMTSFSDDSEIPKWAKVAVLAIKQLGIVEGRGGSSHRTKQQHEPKL